MVAAPSPLTPLDCDLRDFPRMMVDVPRLMNSGFNSAASRNPTAWMVAHKLWYRAWHQVPAASLPDDDSELCHLAELGFDVKTWRKVKGVALRNWVKCDDGRLYHPVVAETALEAWVEKLLQRLSSGAGNATRYGHAFDPAPLNAAIEQAVALLHNLNPRSRAADKLKRRQSRAGAPGGTSAGLPLASLGTETGTGRGIEGKSKAIVPAASPPARKITEYPEGFELAWRAYPHEGGRSSKPNSLAEWRKLPDGEQTDLVHAINRMRPDAEKAFGGKGPPDMARWLKAGKHLSYPGPETAAPTWQGPPEIIAAVLSHQDHKRLGAYLDLCVWQGNPKAILSTSGHIADALRVAVGSALADRGVTILQVAKEPA